MKELPYPTSPLASARGFPASGSHHGGDLSLLDSHRSGQLGPVLACTVLQCILLYVLLYCTAMYTTVLPYCTALHCTVLQPTLLGSKNPGQLWLVLDTQVVPGPQQVGPGAGATR